MLKAQSLTRFRAWAYSAQVHGVSGFGVGQVCNQAKVSQKNSDLVRAMVLARFVFARNPALTCGPLEVVVPFKETCVEAPAT